MTPTPRSTSMPPHLLVFPLPPLVLSSLSSGMVSPSLNPSPSRSLCRVVLEKYVSSSRDTTWVRQVPPDNTVLPLPPPPTPIPTSPPMYQKRSNEIKRDSARTNLQIQIKIHMYLFRQSTCSRHFSWNWKGVSWACDAIAYPHLPWRHPHLC